MGGMAWAPAALGMLCIASHPAAATGYVLGDSLGVGVAQVSRLKGLARISVHIRGPRALEQFAQTPPNSTVFLVLGTNDANGSIARLDKSIDDIVRAAERKNISLVWLGPPCVRKAWDTRARELDDILRRRFSGTAVRYVSMRDEALCSGALHEGDGVHLKTKGYVHMWDKARTAAGFGLAAAEPASATATSATQSPAPQVAARPLVAQPAPATATAQTQPLAAAWPAKLAGTASGEASASLARAFAASADAGPDHTSALKRTIVERVPLPPRRPALPPG